MITHFIPAYSDQHFGCTHSYIMAAIGNLVFCTDCGNLLDEPSSEAQSVLYCDVCGTANKGVSLYLLSS